MSTIPLTLDSYKPTYTAIGGGRAPAPGDPPVSVLLIGRGPNLYRASLIKDYVKAGFSSIVSVEGGADSPELEGLAAKFPQATFVTLREPANVGARINVGMRESAAPFVLVAWNDMRLASSALSSRFFDRVVELDAACLAPDLADRDGAPLPVASNPAHAGKAFKIVNLVPTDDGEKCLYPYDWSGVYSRAKFASLGGFDWTIANPYWQKLDFGMRAWLWGEGIRYARALKLRYDGPPPVDDVTPDADYGRFWLKNLAPSHRGDSAYLPWRRLWGYLLKSRMLPGEALASFKAAKDWVDACSYRFAQDAARLADLWDPIS